MTQDEVLELYRSCGALKEGHFRLSSGLHSPTYFQSARALSHPGNAKILGKALALNWLPSMFDVVLAPALGGIIIAHEVGRAYDKPVLFAERHPTDFVLRRGFALEPGQRVLLVEDVVTTAGSIVALAVLVEAAGAKVVGCGCLIDRRSSSVGGLDPITLVSLAKMAVPAYKPEECTQCLAGVPLEAPGSRHRKGDACSG